MTRPRYLESVRLLRQYFPGCAITTDLIVAFPGETEEEFAKTLTFLQTCGFAAMHIFPYSRRPGTPAAAMPGQHSNAVKQARAAQAGAVADAMTRRYLEGLIGSTQAVLFEEDQDGCVHRPRPQRRPRLPPHRRPAQRDSPRPHHRPVPRRRIGGARRAVIQKSGGSQHPKARVQTAA